METRKVTIINNKTQKQSIIQASSATNLGELKAEMRELGITYEGMTFFEGHMRAELKDDAAPLPTNIPYKGEVVNDLTFLLTAPEKKIKSGTMTRNELIAEAKRLGFAGNPTQAKSTVLADFIAGASKPAAKPAPVKAEKKAKPAKTEEATKTEVATTAAPAQSASCGTCNCEKALKALVEDLYGNDTIEEDTYDNIMGILNGGVSETPASEKMSKKEIDDMFDFAK